MRILMLNNEFPPLGGGTGIVNLRVLGEFSKMEDLEVDLVTSSRTKSTYEQVEMSPRVRIYRVPVNNKCIHHSSSRELITYAIRSYLICWRLAREEKYDLCFAFAGVPAGGVAYLLSLTHRVPYVVSLQGSDVPGFERRYKYLYLVLKPVIRLIWRKACGLTAQSERHKRLALRTDPTAEMVPIGNGVDWDTFRPCAERRQKKDGTANILTVGRLIERKCHRHLLQAAAILRRRGYNSFRFTFTGTGDLEDELKRLCHELDVEDYVRFTGYVTRQEVIAAYENADIFALPSFNEGMSIALLEAIAAGLPVVVTDTGGTAEVVRGNGIVVPRGDAEALADAFARMIDSPQLRAEMSRTSKELIEEFREQFSWEKVSLQYLEVCRQALEKATGRGQNDSRRSPLRRFVERIAHFSGLLKPSQELRKSF